MALKFYISVAKELKLKVRKFLGLGLTSVEVTVKKLVGGRWGLFAPVPTWIGLKQTSLLSIFVENLKMTLAVIHKVRTLRFRDFRPSLSPVSGNALLAYTSVLLVPALGYYFLKKIWQISMTDTYFVNYQQWKNHKQRYKIEKLLYKAIGKCQIKTPRRDLESSLCFLTVRGRWEWIILTVWIAHFLFFISIL